MITERDLEEAIAECQGQRNPNANTCIKLAAFYTIRQHLFPTERVDPEPAPSYSYASGVINYDGDSEFAEAINGLDTQKVLAIIEEAMEAVSVLQPRLYDSIIRKLSDA